MLENKEITVNGVAYTLKEEFDTNLTLTYENEQWAEWHILREFISNALDSVGNDTSQISIQSDQGFYNICDSGVGYPLVYAKRIGATSKRDNTSLIGNFGEGVKLSLLACVRKDITVYLASQNWLIEPKITMIEGQDVLLYNIYETSVPVTGTTVVIQATDQITEIINHLDRYFLQFSKNGDCLHGTITGGIYPLSGDTARLYNKGVYVKDITALYSYAVSLESLNRDRDLISHSHIAEAVCNIWESVSNLELIRTFIQASTLPYQESDVLVELHYSVYTSSPDSWAVAFKELFGSEALLYTDSFAEREAIELGYKVVNCNYRVADLLKGAGIKNDTETLSDDYEFTFIDKLGAEESATLNKISALVGLLDIEAPKNVRVFQEYANHDDILGLYNTRNHQVYMKRDALTSGLEEALEVYLHEANHYISGSDDLSRGFASSLCQMLTRLLLRYSDEVGIKSQVHIVDADIILPPQFPATPSSYANIIAIGNKLCIYTATGTVEVELPIFLASPICGTKRIVVKNQGMRLKLPSKLYSALSYVNLTEPLDCYVKFGKESCTGGIH